MKQRLIVGVDVSKSTLDVCCRPSEDQLQISNNQSGFKQLVRQLKPAKEFEVLFVLEHTGHYSLRFEKFLQSHRLEYCKIAALEIKRSGGVKRGKSDKIDAQRIADYAWLRKDILLADIELKEDIRRLRNMVSMRQKMVKDRAGYIARLKEMKCCGVCTNSDRLGQMHWRIIHQLSKEITRIETDIKELLRSNEEMKKTCQLIMSIKGVGWIIAAYMIGCTVNFKRFANARKFNCYAGLAPFKHESGSSIKGKARVSHLANKRVKVLLNLGASCAIRCDAEIKAYYQRRRAEGKKGMSCLNIVRSKLVSRMFAVVKRQSPYQPHLAA